MALAPSTRSAWPPTDLPGKLYWAITALAAAAALGMLALYTPTEATMGPIQKIFYLHLPSAINTFLACFIVFVASIGYLWQRRPWWDDLADSSAKVAVVLATVVLVTGVVWGRVAWGRWWTWSPRLTFSLLLWLLYVVYLVTRTAIESPQRRAIVAAVYGVFAFSNVPLVWVSVKLMPDIHPSSITLAPAMKYTLLVWFVPVTMLAVGSIVSMLGMLTRTRAARAAQQRPATVREGSEQVA